MSTKTEIFSTLYATSGEIRFSHEYGRIWLGTLELEIPKGEYKRTALLYNLRVHEDHRKLGVGNKLMAAAIEHAKLMGFRKLMLWTDADSWMQKWYEKLGFVEYKRSHNGTRVWMRKSLCELVFSYGSLVLPRNLERFHGEILHSGFIEGYWLHVIKSPITKTNYHYIAAIPTSLPNKIAGHLIEIPEGQLANLDKYEEASYKRVKVSFTNRHLEKFDCWLYVMK